MNEKKERETFSSLPIKTRIAYTTAIASLFIGWILVIVNFFYPPLGEVSDASLWILAQVFLYLGAVVGISTYTRGAVEEIRDELGMRRH